MQTPGGTAPGKQPSPAYKLQPPQSPTAASPRQQRPSTGGPNKCSAVDTREETQTGDKNAAQRDGVTLPNRRTHARQPTMSNNRTVKAGTLCRLFRLVSSNARTRSTAPPRKSRTPSVQGSSCAQLWKAHEMPPLTLPPAPWRALTTGANHPTMGQPPPSRHSPRHPARNNNPATKPTSTQVNGGLENYIYHATPPRPGTHTQHFTALQHGISTDILRDGIFWEKPHTGEIWRFPSIALHYVILKALLWWRRLDAGCRSGPHGTQTTCLEPLCLHRHPQKTEPELKNHDHSAFALRRDPR